MDPTEGMLLMEDLRGIGTPVCQGSEHVDVTGAVVRNEGLHARLNLRTVEFRH